MASAKLEILISAKDAASQVLGRVKGAFALRAAEIQGMSQQLMKNGEKVEKFLHGVSLLKMATETESFKTALAGVSPTLQKTTSDLLNMGVAIGGTLSLAKDLSHVLPTIGMKGVGALAATAGLYVLGKSVTDRMNDESNKTIRQANTSGPILSELYKRQGEATDLFQLNKVEMDARDATTKAINDSNFILADSLRKLVRNINDNSANILKVNQLNAARLQQAKNFSDFQAAQEEARAMIAKRFAESPAGQMQRFNRASADLARWQGATISPESNPREWLKQQEQIALLTDEIKALNAGPIGKVREMFDAIKAGSQSIFRPRRTTTTTLGPLPGSAILGDALSRQGLFSGGGRANPLTGLTDRTLTSIDSGTKELVRLLRGIWQAVTTGNTSALAP